MTAAQTIQMSLADALAKALSMAQSGDLEGACRLYGDVLTSVPDNVTALMNLGVVRLQRGEGDEGIRLLERARELAPEDETIRGNLFNAYTVKCGLAQANGDWVAALRETRNLIALGGASPAHLTNLQGFLSYTETPAILSDYQPDIEAENLGRTVLIACMPKSGSSWLVSAVLKLSGFQQAFLSNAYIENDQDLYPPFVASLAGTDKVVHQHCRATAPTLHLVQAYGMTPIVLVRNLADTLVSMCDFWGHGAVRNSFYYGDWDSLDQETKHDTLIQHLGPWYLQFYVSWKLAESKGDAAPLWVRYEDMIPDKPGTLRKVAEFCNLAVSAEEIAAAIVASDGDREKTRFNKGVAGRGAETFTPAQLDRLRELTRPFPSIDFSPIGL